MPSQNIQPIPEDEPASSASEMPSVVQQERASARPSGPHMDSKQLSVVSSKYDVGSKGFLTPAEQRMREMDTAGKGQLTNEQVSKIVEQTMSLRDVNSRLRFWVIALFGAVIILGLSNLGTAFAAAVLAKDTTVDSDSGRMSVKSNTNINVVTISAGKAATVDLRIDADGYRYFCMDTLLAASLMNSTFEGTRNTLAFKSDDGLFTVGLVSSRTRYNANENCFGTDDPVIGDICSKYALINRCVPTNGQRQRHLAHQERARTFRQTMRGAVAVTTTSHQQRHLENVELGGGDVQDYCVGPCNTNPTF